MLDRKTPDGTGREIGRLDIVSVITPRQGRTRIPSSLKKPKEDHDYCVDHATHTHVAG
jgi:hypothetical protein